MHKSPHQNKEVQFVMKNIFDRKWMQNTDGCLTFIFYQKSVYEKYNSKNYFFEKWKLHFFAFFKNLKNEFPSNLYFKN